MPTWLRFRRRYDPLLVVVDALCAALACWLAYRLGAAGDLPLAHDDVQRLRAAGIGLVVSWVLLSRTAGLYRREVFHEAWTRFRAALVSAALCGFALLLADLAALGGKLPGGWIAAVVAGLLVLGVLTRTALGRSRRVLDLVGARPVEQ